ncbi:MAG: UDP-N-acetylglucosamine--N-acetylmuramyl-(pentapeptide) [Geobacteraceae bacterium]|nr:MAG: UDP-N-acetylglucosamine--N-acetylmuramyl-(pentapeptide) [Geobacteraceae bacterium]
MRLLIAGGGTGGHLFPGIAVAEEFLARDANNEVLFVGTEAGIEARVLPRRGYRLEYIAAAGMRGKSRLSQARSMAMLLYGYAQSRKILKGFRPDVVLGVGGYASGPVVMAARGMQIRRFIHEQNAIPGFTNKVLARFAEGVFISLEESRTFFPQGNTMLTGNPVRHEILADVQKGEDEDRSGNDFRLLVFGGSAGAHSINQSMIAALPSLGAFRDRLSVTHQTGEKDLAEVREAYQRGGFKAEVIPFIDNMAAAYRTADLVLCRAGATTIAEVTACGKTCIFIPYPHAVDDHQRRNAEALLKKGAGFMLLEQELSGERLARMIVELMEDPERLEMTGRCAKRLARLDAAQVIVDEMLKELQPTKG